MQQSHPQDKPDLSDNPFLRLEDPRGDSKVKESEAAALAAEFQRLCYSVFHEYADGKRLWEKFHDMYLLSSQVNPAAQNAGEMAIWWDGFKNCMIGMYNHGKAHIKRTNGVG